MTAPIAPNKIKARGLRVFDKLIRSNPPVATVKVEVKSIPDKIAPKYPS